MLSLVLAIFVSAIGCLLLTPLLRGGLRRLGLVETHERRVPDAGPIPRMGGVAVLAAAGLGVSAPYWFHTDVARQVRPDAALLAHLLPAVLFVLAAGVFDDAFGLSPRVKLLAQIVASLMVCAQGVRITQLFGHMLPAWGGLVLTVVWLVGCTNAFNLLDGLDGLAAGVALFATVTVMMHALLSSNLELALLTGSMTGALGAFLYFNFFPASIFLGDAGSLSIGFLLGCFGLLWMEKSTTMLGLTAPLLAMMVPLFDTAISIVRRWLAHQPILQGDQSHVHHRLVQLGLTPRNAVLLLYGVAAAGALAGLLAANLRQQQVTGLVILIFIVSAGLAVHLLGFAEFSEATRLWRRSVAGHRRKIRCMIEVRRLLQRATTASDCNELWTILCQLAQWLELNAIELRVGSEARPLWKRREWLTAAGAGNEPSGNTDPGEFPGWRLTIPVGEAGGLGAVTFWTCGPGHLFLPLQELAAEVEQAMAPRIHLLGMETSPRARAADRG